MDNLIWSGTLPGSVERKEVLRYLGYKGQTVDESLSSRIDTIIADCEKDLRASYVMRFFAVSEGIDEKGSTFLEVHGSGLNFYGKSIQKYLKGAVQCALFAVTLGAKSEQQLIRHNATNPLDAMVYDATCSALVESVAEMLENKVAHQAESAGMTTKHRYSPGYGDFSLSIQRSFLDTLQAPKRIGLTVTDNDLMIPTKSVSAVVGLFETR